jgi:hypothetical protein
VGATLKPNWTEVEGMREKPLELLTLEEQIPKLRAFLHPYRSRLRPFLALFAIKNYLLREAGLVVKNDPTVRWYQDRLIKAGVTASYWSVHYQLRRLAQFGVLDRTRSKRKVIRQRLGRYGVVAVQMCEFPLNIAIYPALEQALKQLLGVDSFLGLTGLDDP